VATTAPFFIRRSEGDFSVVFILLFGLFGGFFTLWSHFRGCFGRFFFGFHQFVDIHGVIVAELVRVLQFGYFEGEELFPFVLMGMFEDVFDFEILTYDQGRKTRL
jgi:hypothetical protein